MIETPQPWIRIKLSRLMYLTEYAPVRLRWKFLREKRAGKTVLLWVSPRGLRYHFKLSGHAWIRKETC